MQGMAQQFYGIPLLPERIRRAIADTGFPQAGVPTPAGFDDAVPCGPDTDPEEEPNRIGPYPRPDLAGAYILSQWNVGFDDAPLVDDVVIIRGNHQFGNKFSIKGSDNNYLVVDSLYTERKHRPNVMSPGSAVNYLATAQTVDVMVVAHADVPSSNMQVDTEIQPIDASTLLFVEMYDWVAKRWSFVNFEPLDIVTCPDGVDKCDSHLATAAQRFIAPNGRNVYIRLYMLRMGSIDSGAATPTGGTVGSGNAFTARIDLVNLITFQGFGGSPGRPGDSLP